MISYNATGTYTYRLTDKGVKVALLFLFSISASAAGSPAVSFTTGGKAHPKVRLEAAYHKAEMTPSKKSSIS
jgi:hypothetical protein